LKPLPVFFHGADDRDCRAVAGADPSQAAELVQMLGDEIVEGNAALGIVRRHRLADLLHSRIGLVGVSNAELLADPSGLTRSSSLWSVQETSYESRLRNAIPRCLTILVTASAFAPASYFFTSVR
jgi:hypothetical protein